MSQLAGKVMLKQGKGKIINIASTNSFIGLRNMPAYVSSKGGVKQLTMALSSEWSGRGINVNAIASRLHGHRNEQGSAADGTGQTAH